MVEQLENLFDLYKKYNNKFKFNNHEPNILEFNDKTHEDLLYGISLNKINNFYYIFLYIEKESKLMFKGLIHKSTDNLKDLYNKIFDEFSNENMESFVSKYYTSLENNFLY